MTQARPIKIGFWIEKGITFDYLSFFFIFEICNLLVVEHGSRAAKGSSCRRQKISRGLLMSNHRNYADTFSPLRLHILR
jgi:hypothetical protein